MRPKKINTVAYVHWDDELICTDDLPPDKKSFVGAHLKAAYLNGLYQGKATFTPILPKELQKYSVKPY